jgi:hypothetical protein
VTCRKRAQRNLAGDFGALEPFFGWFKGFEGEEPVNASKQNERDWSVFPACS